jgi:phospholipid N-methyltransferase
MTVMRRLSEGDVTDPRTAAPGRSSCKWGPGRHARFIGASHGSRTDRSDDDRMALSGDGLHSTPARVAAPALPAARRDARAEQRTFFGAWLRNPRAIGSVTPSSRRLARLITSRIGPGDGPVIELGPGTGVFTEALLARGVREQDLYLIESQPDLVALLRRRFPAACVLQLDAARLGALDPFDGRLATAAISGLPILWFGRGTAERILRGLLGLMRADAALYQFTYQLWCPIPRALRDALDLEAVRIGWTPANFPPASVYRITRRARRR